jgi:hypothetical protein
MEKLHTYNNGTSLLKTTAKTLLLLHPWKGQRILDPEHVKELKESVGKQIQNLDNGYALIRYAGEELSPHYIIDGQHRAYVLKGYFEANPDAPDFTVTATQKLVGSEEEAISYFKVLNTSKPMDLAEDPMQVVNVCLTVILKAFNTDKKCPLIRPSDTRTPYVSADKIRNWIQKQVLPRGFNAAQALAALNHVNQRHLDENELKGVFENAGDKKTFKKALELGFMLGFTKEREWTLALKKE